MVQTAMKNDNNFGCWFALLIASTDTNRRMDWCDCNWLDDFPGGSIPCGCGKPECVCRLFRDPVIHWRGGHWRLDCAFLKLETIAISEAAK